MMQYLQGQPAALVRRRSAGEDSTTFLAQAPVTKSDTGSPSSTHLQFAYEQVAYEQAHEQPLEERVMEAVDQMNSNRRRVEQNARTARFIAATKVISPRPDAVHCRAYSTALASHVSIQLTGKGAKRVSGKAFFPANVAHRSRNGTGALDHLRLAPPYNYLNHMIPSNSRPHSPKHAAANGAVLLKTKQEQPREQQFSQRLQEKLKLQLKTQLKTQYEYDRFLKATDSTTERVRKRRIPVRRKRPKSVGGHMSKSLHGFVPIQDGPGRPKPAHWSRPKSSYASSSKTTARRQTVDIGPSYPRRPKSACPRFIVASPRAMQTIIDSDTTGNNDMRRAAIEQLENFARHPGMTRSRQHRTKPQGLQRANTPSKHYARIKRGRKQLSVRGKGTLLVTNQNQSNVRSPQSPQEPCGAVSSNSLAVDHPILDSGSFMLGESELTSWDVTEPERSLWMKPGPGVSKIVVTRRAGKEMNGKSRNKKKGGRRSHRTQRSKHELSDARDSSIFNLDRLEEVAESASTDIGLLVAI